MLRPGFRKLHISFRGGKHLRIQIPRSRGQLGFETLDQAFHTAFGPEMDLAAVPQDMLQVLHTGTAQPGMDKMMVRLVEGPPPSRLNPLGEESQMWTYKKHGFGRTMKIHFDEHGIVTGVDE